MQVNALDINSTTFPPAKIGSFAIILNVFIPVIMTGAALVFFVMLMYGGFTWLTAGDNPENIKKAQKTLTYAVLGLIIVISSFLVVKLIAIILKVDTSIPL